MGRARMLFIHFSRPVVGSPAETMDTLYWISKLAHTVFRWVCDSIKRFGITADGAGINEDWPLETKTRAMKPRTRQWAYIGKQTRTFLQRITSETRNGNVVENAKKTKRKDENATKDPTATSRYSKRLLERFIFQKNQACSKPAAYLPLSERVIPE